MANTDDDVVQLLMLLLQVLAAALTRLKAHKVEGFAYEKVLIHQLNPKVHAHTDIVLHCSFYAVQY
jgi:hypothetical protein